MLMSMLSIYDNLEAASRSFKRLYEDRMKRDLRELEESQMKVELIRPASNTNSKVFECPVCMDSIGAGEGYVIPGCEHTYCKNCLCGYLTDKISEAAVIDIACVDPSCTTLFTYQDVKNLVSKEMFAKFEDFSLMAALKKDPDMRWCPNPKGCGNAILGDPSTTKVLCDQCQYQFCFLCNEEWHTGTCDDYQKWKEENGKVDVAFSRWARENSKPCPKCKSRTEKNTGCNHMTCASCQYDWCWLCGGKCGPGHFDSYNLLGCAGLQFDETDEVSHHFGKRVKGKMTAAGTLALGVAAISVGAAIAPLALGGYAVSRVIR
eukprot:TRINITY_DN8392_c0_g1_i1.p1 TRINITY_DN8392_c0_g1~~TRINITY_DN8392_c0_g1_i1.p1  ORF type:complete len:319 (-),score=77.25 TRINITY_DN8392_c0_g1_i1:56-1012(-)